MDCSKQKLATILSFFLREISLCAPFERSIRGKSALSMLCSGIVFLESNVTQLKGSFVFYWRKRSYILTNLYDFVRNESAFVYGGKVRFGLK